MDKLTYTVIDSFSTYLLIRSLFLRKPASIDTVIYPVVNPFISFIDFSLELRRVKVQIRISRNMIELGVEHPDYFCTLVVHNSLEFLIPQNLQIKTETHDQLTLTKEDLKYIEKQKDLQEQYTSLCSVG